MPVFPQPGGSPGGANTNVQYNDNGAFGGSGNLTWNGSELNVGGNSIIRGSVGPSNHPTGRNLIIGNNAEQGGTDTTYDSVCIGDTARVSYLCVTIGATAEGWRRAQCVTIGAAAYTGAVQSTAVGFQANCQNASGNAVAVGAIAGVRAEGGTAIGRAAVVDTNHTSSVSIGKDSFTTAANQLVIGSSGASIAEAHIGAGVGGAGAALFVGTVQLPEQVSDPPTPGGVVIYSKDVAGTKKLFVQDSAGTVTQLGT